MPELFLGLMSGTSLDGIDLMLAEIDTPFALVETRFRHLPFDTDTRAALQPMVEKGCDSTMLPALNAHMGERYGAAIKDFLQETGTRPEQVTAIGMHGVTFRHTPDPTDTPLGKGRGTQQLGDPFIVAARTGIPVIYDFRHADMAFGGQGAPMVPFLEHLLFRHECIGRVVLNLGGIANLTYLPPDGKTVLAFDSGPANMIMDALMQVHLGKPGAFDQDGRLSAQGRVIDDLLKECLAEPYLALAPPKSTGRELFGEDYAAKFLAYGKNHPFADLMATAAKFTAITVAEALKRWAPEPWQPETFEHLVVSGGGVHNQTLLAMLAEHLPWMQIMATNDLEPKVDPDAKEALLMAAFAWAHVHEVPGNFPSVTGADRAVVLGARTGRIG